MSQDFYNLNSLNYLQAAMAVDDTVTTLLQERYAAAFLGVHATRRVLEEISETMTRHLWKECPWGQEHFRLQAEMIDWTLNLTFIPMSQAGTRMQDALRYSRMERP